MNYIHKITNELFELEYNNFLEDINDLVLDKINIQIVSRNSNNNIFIINNLIKKIWNIDIYTFYITIVNNEFETYLKNNLKYSNKHANDYINIFENNIKFNNINHKILYIDFKKFKFTEQKYYIYYLEYIINLNTINKIHYVIIINNFDYILQEYYKTIIYMLEKNELQIIIFTSNTNIKSNFKSFVLPYQFKNYNLNNLIDIVFNNLNYNNVKEKKQFKFISLKEYKNKYSLIINDITKLLYYDITKIIIVSKLYLQFLYDSQFIDNIFIDISYLDIKNNNKVDDNNNINTLVHKNYFITNYINKNFIIIKYITLLTENIILINNLIYFINNYKIIKKDLKILFTKLKQLYNNIRYLTYSLSSQFDTIEELILKLNNIILIKYKYIIQIKLYLEQLLDINQDFNLSIHNINNINNIINNLLYSELYNEKIFTIELSNIIFNLDIKNILKILDNLLTFIKNNNITLSLETKNKNINNKFNKLLFILNNNNII